MINFMLLQNVPLPTMDQIQTKQKEIAYYMAYNLSSAELDYVGNNSLHSTALFR